MAKLGWRLVFLVLTLQQLDIMHRSPRRVILTAAKLNKWYQFYTHLFWEIKPSTSAQYLIKNKLVAHERLAFLIFTQQQLDLMHRSLKRDILTAAKLNMWYQFYTHLFWEIKPPTSAQHLIKNKLVAHCGYACLVKRLALQSASINEVSVCLCSLCCKVQVCAFS